MKPKWLTSAVNNEAYKPIPIQRDKILFCNNAWPQPDYFTYSLFLSNLIPYNLIYG